MANIPICLNPVIVKERKDDEKFGTFFDYDRAEAINQVRPYVLEIEPTNKCAASCAWCLSSSRVVDTTTMPKEKFKEVLDDSYDLGVRYVSWSGGDPILHPDWYELVSYAGEKGMTGVFLTSGMLTRDNIKGLCALEGVLDSVSVHISTINPSIYARVHNNPKTLEVRMAGYRNLLEAGYPADKITTIITLTSPVVESLEETVDWFVDEMGAPVVCIGVFKGSGFGAQHLDWEPGLTQVKRAFEYRAKKLGDHWLRLGPSGASFFYCRTALVVLNNGDVTPCSCCRELALANVYQEGLKDIFEQHRDALMFNQPIKGFCGTGDCQNSDICNGCRGNAYRYTGDILESDPKCWLNTGAKEYYLRPHYPLSVPI